MNRMGWSGRLGAALVFVAGLVGFGQLLSLGSPRAVDENPVSYAITSVILATPAAVAGALLWRAWWLGIGIRLVAMDAPGRLVAAAVATLPDDRRDWGLAMAAELTQVPDRRERWRFAIGCARTAVFPPRGRWAPVLVVAALATAAAVITALLVDRALPDLRIFAVTFVGLVGALATVAVSRARRLRRPAAGLPIAVTGLASVAACIGVTGYYLSDGSLLIDRTAAIELAAVLAAGLWLSLIPPRALTTSRRARVTGLRLGAALAAGMFLSSRIFDGGVGGFLLIFPFLALFTAAALVAGADRSVWAGLQTVVWAMAITCMLSFTVYLVEAVRYGQAKVHVIFRDDVPGYTGTDLQEAIGWVFATLPTWSVPFGIIGAVLGAISRTPRDPATAAPVQQAP